MDTLGRYGTIWTFSHDYAKHATNIAITGQGTIDAQGGREFASWSQIEVSDRNRLRKWEKN